MEPILNYSDALVSWAMLYGPKLLGALLVLIIGWWIVNKVAHTFERLMLARQLEPGLTSFLASLINAALKVLLVISVASIVGIETTSFVAVIGAAGLAIGLALQGSLANFAGGALIMIFKPFKVGDYIEAQGYGGTVKQIQIFVSVLVTPDNKTVIIPNGPLAGGSMINYSTQDKRRVDMKFGISYGDDIAQAKAVLQELIRSDARILQDEANLVAVAELADSSVNLVVRTWVKASDYWAVYFDMHERVKLTFDAKGISIPFPQRDVHLRQVG